MMPRREAAACSFGFLIGILIILRLPAHDDHVQVLVAQSPPLLKLYDLLPNFTFHVYELPPELLDDIVNMTNPHQLPVHPMLDWRNDDMQLMAPYWLAYNLRLHPLHSPEPEQADIFIIPHLGPLVELLPDQVRNYPARLRQFLLDKYGHYIKRRRSSDHFTFDFSVGSRFWGILPDIHALTYEVQPFQLLMTDWSFASDSIVIPFVDRTPAFLERLEAANRAHSDLEFVRSEPKRTLLAFFSSSYTGPSGKLRTRLMQLMEAQNDTMVHFLRTRHSPDKYDVIPSSMLRSVFCPCPSGDSPTARRQYTAVLAGCIPVILSDFTLHAYDGYVDWTKFSIQLPTSILAQDTLFDYLRSIPSERIEQMQVELLVAARRFVYHLGPPQPGDALDTLVEHLALHAFKVRRTNAWMKFTNGTTFANLRLSNGKVLNFYPDNLDA